MLLPPPCRLYIRTESLISAGTAHFNTELAAIPNPAITDSGRPAVAGPPKTVKCMQIAGGEKE